MELKPTIVFCTTCKNRTQHLEQTLPRNLMDNLLPNSKFVVLDYNSEDHMSKHVLEYYKKEIDSGKLIYYKYYERHSFRMAHAKNMAHRLGILEGADILVNLDADNFTGKNFDQYIQDKFSEHNGVFLWANMIKGVMPKGISGRIIVTKDQFLNVGGYDEKYHTYSPDDKDFKARLVRMEYNPLEIDAKYLNAVRHNDKMRFREYPDAADADAEDFCIDQYNRVVNYGKIGCGRVTRNYCMNAIDLKSIPTRIFGIGMHKTGTTSLHHALIHLGYNSGHWKNAHWAKAIWAQMKTEGRSLTLEKCYALSDLPIPELYKEIDVAYPNSKYILTLREESEWIESVRKHWDPKYNPHRKYWKNDPFTNIIHRIVYDQNGFDAELFLNKYRQHNKDVLEYFKDRPDDLQVVNMGTGKEWVELCTFLKHKIPSIPFPTSNKAPIIES